MADVKFEISLEEKQALDAIKRLSRGVDDFADGAEKGFKQASHAVDTFKGVLAAEALIKGVELVADAFKELFHIVINEGVQAAIKEEQALTALSFALDQAGNGSANAKKEFLDFANELEELTGIQDDVTLKNLALLQSFGPLTKEGLKEATKAAADLAAKYQVDLETAIRAVGASAQGNLGLLQRITKQTFENGATDAETFELAIKKINDISFGAAEAQMQTFQGAITGTKNSFEDFIKELGKLITENPAVKEAIKVVGETFKELEAFVNANKEEIKAFISEGVLFLIDAFKVAVGFVKDFVKALNEPGTFLNDLKNGFIALFEAIKIVFQSASESGAILNTLIQYFKALYSVVQNIASIFSDVLDIAIGAVINAFFAMGVGVNDILNVFKRFTGFILGAFLSTLDVALNGLGRVVGIFDKELGAKISNAIAPLKQFAKELQAAGTDEVQNINKTAEAKNREVASHVAGEEKKTEATQKGALIRSAAAKKEITDLDFAKELDKARLEDQKKFADTEKKFQSEKEQALLNILKEGLGKRATANLIADVLRLQNEQKFSEARLKLLEAEEKAKEEISKNRTVATEAPQEIDTSKIDFKAASLAAEAELQAQFDATQLEFAAKQQEDLFNLLVEGLGKREALQAIQEVKNLTAAGQAKDARIKIAQSEQAAKDNIQKLEEQRQKERISTVKEALGTISTLQSDSNKELFFIGKAAAIANATIAGYEGAAKALALGPPLGFILAGLVAVASAANIARIAATQPPSRQTGGILPGVASPTDTTLFNGAPGELILNRRQQTDLFNAINQNQIGGSGGGVNVVIQGNVMADDDSQVQKLIERINDNIQFRNAAIVG